MNHVISTPLFVTRIGSVILKSSQDSELRAPAVHGHGAVSVGVRIDTVRSADIMIISADRIYTIYGISQIVGFRL